MTRLLDTGLEELATILLRMGEAAEESVRVSIRGFMNGGDLSDEVKELSEMLDTMSVTVEEKGLRADSEISTSRIRSQNNKLLH